MLALMHLGSAPYEEDCVATGSPNYVERQIAECDRFIELLRKRFGAEPAGVTIGTYAESHDFGTYYEVVAEYDETNANARAFAAYVEENLPATWEDDLDSKPRFNPVLNDIPVRTNHSPEEVRAMAAAGCPLSWSVNVAVVDDGYGNDVAYVLDHDVDENGDRIAH